MHITYTRKYPPEQYGGEELTFATSITVEEGEDPFEVAYAAAVIARNTAHRVLGIPPVRPSKPFEPGEVKLFAPGEDKPHMGAPPPKGEVAGVETAEEPKTTTRFTKAAARREIAAMVEAGELDEARLSVIVQKWDDMGEEADDARAKVTGTAITQEVESGVADEVVSPQALMTKVADISNRLGDGGAAAVRALFPKFSDPDGLPATRLGEIPESRRAAFIAAAEALISG